MSQRVRGEIRYPFADPPAEGAATEVAEGILWMRLPLPMKLDHVNIYALDDGERQGILDHLEAEKSRAKVHVTRFKGLGEMSPSQLRETTMAPETRRLVQLTVKAKDKTEQTLDMLLAKKRSRDRRDWLEAKGDLAEV